MADSIVVDVLWRWAARLTCCAVKCDIRGSDDEDADTSRVKVMLAIKPARRSEWKYVHADVRLHMSAIFSILHMAATISAGSRCILYSRLGMW